MSIVPAAVKAPTVSVDASKVMPPLAAMAPVDESEVNAPAPAVEIDQLLSVMETLVADASPMVMVLACELLPIAIVFTAAPVLPILIVSALASVPILIV
ncbi:MAG: hypothetical protein WAT84_02080, partial [Candidatus Moraniibacteriota bacterium]